MRRCIDSLCVDGEMDLRRLSKEVVVSSQRSHEDGCDATPRRWQ